MSINNVSHDNNLAEDFPEGYNDNYTGYQILACSWKEVFSQAGRFLVHSFSFKEMPRDEVAFGLGQRVFQREKEIHSCRSNMLLISSLSRFLLL